MPTSSQDVLLRPRQDQDAPNVIAHAGALPYLEFVPGYLTKHARPEPAEATPATCGYCGVGDYSSLRRVATDEPVVTPEDAWGHVTARTAGGVVRVRARIIDGKVLAFSKARLCQSSPHVTLEFACDTGKHYTFAAVLQRGDDCVDTGDQTQVFDVRQKQSSTAKRGPRGLMPTTGCVKFKASRAERETAFPIHTEPSYLNRKTGKRVRISYERAIAMLATMVLDHRPPMNRRTLVYASGQIDYFAIFAFQEVFRLLGMRNLTGNAEHCLNAGAVFNEMLTGQEGPYLTIQDAVAGDNRFFLMMGWNGKITHPPVLRAMLRKPDFDGYLIEVLESETAMDVAEILGSDRLLLIRSGADPLIALAVIHELFERYPDALDTGFIEAFSDPKSLAQLKALAMDPRYSPAQVAKDAAPEDRYELRLYNGIKAIAARLVERTTVPIVISSVGLSQTSGVVGHGLWGSLLAMIGKFGLHKGGAPRGGVLRLPGQINAQSEIQGLSRKYFLGRLAVTQYAQEVARRMLLPDNAYDVMVADASRSALDYSDPAEQPELFLCFGTQFETNMMGRKRWLEKLESSGSTLVVIDPIPDAYTLEHADLILPSPPHPAAPKLYQNGEWRLMLNVPSRAAATQTRSDATIVYDVMAQISRWLRTSHYLRLKHPDLAPHALSGYLEQRFENPVNSDVTVADHALSGLIRVDGEVSRPQLFNRIQAYLCGDHGDGKPLYCAFVDENNERISFQDLIDHGPQLYGGVGKTRYAWDARDPQAPPFGDLFGNPVRFKFFTPHPADLELPNATVLNSGRSPLSTDKKRLRFATATFNSGKHTPVDDMPADNPLYVSNWLAKKRSLSTGGFARVSSAQTGASVVYRVIVSDRVKGNAVYASFHKTHAEMNGELHINDVVSHEPRCAYSGQTRLKRAEVSVDAVDLHADP